LAIASKEPLVMAGEIIMREAEKSGAQILPVDSEHSAIFQCLMCGQRREVKKIILTASGGPFFGKKRSSLENITPDEALRHPKWNMGRKISVDSATLMNKGLEIIEARNLFGIPNIEVVIHPESVIHSMVEWRDGNITALLSPPTMLHPIQFALTYPERLDYPGEKLDFSSLGKLTFYNPDEETFKSLALSRRAMNEGGIMPTILTCANEIAVEKFLSGEIKFLEIADFVEREMNLRKNIQNPTIRDIIKNGEEIMRTAF
jgi:1-deoxy-D-xylulose-5-phosphate reductoisomerase